MEVRRSRGWRASKLGGEYKWSTEAEMILIKAARSASENISSTFLSMNHRTEWKRREMEMWMPFE